MSQESRMSQTGKNFLIALVISLILALVLTILYSIAAVILKLDGKEKVEITAAIIGVSHYFFNIFFGLSKCVVPVVTIFAFALLQRFRIKDNLDATEIENEA